MLLQFTTKNFKAFKEKATLSLVASNYDKTTRETDNVHEDLKFNLRLLKSAVVYGANASGKSKLFDALLFMRRFVVTSSRESQKGDLIEVDPFRLDDESETMPTEFEVVFTYKEVLYRYGFEANKVQIVSEWLYYKPKTKEIELFYRDSEGISTHDRNFSKGNMVIKEGLVRDNALLVSVAAQFNDATCIAVIDWFRGLNTISGLHESSFKGYTMNRTKDPIHKLHILELLKAADLGIQDIHLQKFEDENLPKKMSKELKTRIIKEMNEEKKELVSDILTTHKRYNTLKKAYDTVNFSLDDDESSGTKKFFALTRPILDVLENGHTLVVDELDSKLHPNLVGKIVSLFNSKEFNPKNAQLIFNTHNTNLLKEDLFSRDQIWITEKNKYGAAKLYSLADFKSDTARKMEPFEENYIRGKYGAVPFLNSFDYLNEMLPKYENAKQKD